MQAHVKMPHIKIDIEGEIPNSILKILKKEYGDQVQIITDEYEDAFETDWYKKIKANLHPGKYVRAYRENKNMTQTQLGEKLDGLSKQCISDMENGRRAISMNIAKKLSKLFNRPVEKFLNLEVE